MCVYIYIYRERENTYIYIYVHTYIHRYMYLLICVYIYGCRAECAGGGARGALCGVYIVGQLLDVVSCSGEVNVCHVYAEA